MFNFYNNFFGETTKPQIFRFEASFLLMLSQTTGMTVRK
jgi:hypothetical protein